eukprot:TRINITY_DN25930_c0_g2_i1.p1 TRINITY_DN25930_c0_g2~~TRINITY_DN25930_c0_g2_i1.p1  ORF type:complete len:508 (+),score=162.21 TRINITY_DN25930_c0_g2_i1:94-1524(+)
MAVSLLAAYVDGFEALAKCALVAESPDLLSAICRDDPEESPAEVVPWILLKEVTAMVILRPMVDDAMALSPVAEKQATLRPSEAVLAAESTTLKLLQMANSWSQRLEQQGLSGLAVPWLACVDETCAMFWKVWDKLFETFRSTIAQKHGGREGGSPEAGSFSSGFDAALLNECMQLHGLLHDSIPASFGSFRTEALRTTGRLAASDDQAFGRAISLKLQGAGDAWCERLGVPSVAALKAAYASVAGVGAGAMPPSAGLEAPASILPAASKALAAAEKEARDIVTKCCVQPVAAILAGYPEEPQWLRADGTAGDLAGGLMPLGRVTAVGEHLFSLVPQLERSQDGSQIQYLPTVLEAVVETAVQQALLIKKMTLLGAEQLIVDMEYVQKVTDALGHNDDGTGDVGNLGALPLAAAAPKNSLAEFLQAMTFLSSQLKKRQECTARGEAYAEDDAVPGLSRRFERPLRAALGLERPLVA